MILLMLSLLACDSDPGDVVLEGERGFVSVCLGASSWDGEQAYGELLWEIDGEVIDDTDISDVSLEPDTLGNLFNCTNREARMLTIEDGDGVQWWLGYGVADGEQLDLTEALDVAPGLEVQLLVRALYDFGDAAGFTLRDGEGLIAAYEDGDWGPGLEATDHPEVVVSQGEEIEVVNDGCGDMASYATRFAADGEVEVIPVGTAPLVVEGTTMTAAAVADYDFLTYECTDLAGAREWAVWR